MAINLNTNYPGKVTVDANNPNGTFKNRTSDILKDGTPFEKAWASDVWGFLSHILSEGGVSPNGAEENETNSQYYDTLAALIGRIGVQWDVEDLQIDYTGNADVNATFKSISLLDDNYIPKFLRNKDLTWTMPTDLEAGTSEKNTTWYDMWLDSDETLILAPRLTGTCDSTVSGFLADSTATFLTDLVHAGDIAQNIATGQITTCLADAAAQGQVAVVDNIFTSGDDYQIIKLSPVGLGANKERIGMVFNNASGNFDNTGYLRPELQKVQRYYENGPYGDDFSTSGTNWTSDEVEVDLFQVLDEAQLPAWKLSNFTAEGSLSIAATTFTLTISGITTIARNQKVGLYHLNAAGNIISFCYAPPSGNTILMSTTGGSVSLLIYKGELNLLSKPTWGTRS